MLGTLKIWTSFFVQVSFIVVYHLLLSFIVVYRRLSSFFVQVYRGLSLFIIKKILTNFCTNTTVSRNSIEIVFHDKVTGSCKMWTLCGRKKTDNINLNLNCNLKLNLKKTIKTNSQTPRVENPGGRGEHNFVGYTQGGYTILCLIVFLLTCFSENLYIYRSDKLLYMQWEPHNVITFGQR